MTADEDLMRDQQIRVLLQHSDTLAQQVAELTIGQQRAQAWRDAGDHRIAAIEDALQANTAIIVEVRDLLAAFKGGFKVLGWLGTGAKWAGAVAGAAVALYTLGYMATHGGNPPGWK